MDLSGRLPILHTAHASIPGSAVLPVRPLSVSSLAKATPPEPKSVTADMKVFTSESHLHAAVHQPSDR